MTVNCCVIYCFSLLSKKNLHKFELACLANLCPETAEEAKALIPRYVSILFICGLCKHCQASQRPVRIYHKSFIVKHPRACLIFGPLGVGGWGGVLF